MELRDEKNKNRNWKTSELMLRLGAVGMFVISGVLILIFILFLPDKKMSSRVDSTIETIQLCSINTDSDIKGDFILGCGSVKNKEVYVAYQLLEDGGKKYITMDRSNTIIYEDLNSDEMPYAEILSDSKEIKLHVPEGTIMKNIDINL